MENEHFQENLKIPKIRAFFCAKANVEVSENHFDIWGISLRLIVTKTNVVNMNNPAPMTSSELSVHALIRTTMLTHTYLNTLVFVSPVL